MAIDTAERRKSVAGIPFGLGVTPNASKDAEWRQQVGYSYSGIASAAALIILQAAGEAMSSVLDGSITKSTLDGSILSSVLDGSDTGV